MKQRWFVRLTLMLVTLGLVVACQQSPQTGVSEGTADCTEVKHFAGTACVPQEIQRLVTLDSVAYEYAIAADLQPIGTVAVDFQTPLPALNTDATEVGKGGEPNLEAILALKPDLLVGLDFHEGIYPQLAQIAPTLLVQFAHSGQWQEIFLETGKALNQTAAAQATLDAYQARATEFKTQMGSRLQDLQVSVIRLYPDSINLYLQDSFCGTVLQDAGLARPPAQAIGAAEAEQHFKNPIQATISRELLTQADGDVIFVWTGENTPEANQQAQQRLQELQQDPLWQQLKAVQAGRVYQVPSYWIGSGPIAANGVLDDLFKFILEQA